MKRIYLPVSPTNKEELLKLKVMDKVLLTGKIYGARDAVHKRLMEEKNWQPAMQGSMVYYTAPTPPAYGNIIGAIGPTTSIRMDNYTELLLQRGIVGTIGKGPRNPHMAKIFKKYQAVYLITIGGAGAWLTQFVKNIKIIAYEELYPEALYEIEVEDFPAYVWIDANGSSPDKKRCHSEELFAVAQDRVRNTKISGFFTLF